MMHANHKIVLSSCVVHMHCHHTEQTINTHDPKTTKASTSHGKSHSVALLLRHRHFTSTNTQPEDQETQMMLRKSQEIEEMKTMTKSCKKTINNEMDLMQTI